MKNSLSQSKILAEMNPVLFRGKKKITSGCLCWDWTKSATSRLYLEYQRWSKFRSHIDCSSEPIRWYYKINKNEELRRKQLSGCQFKKFKIILLKAVDIENFDLSLFFEDRLIYLYIVNVMSWKLWSYLCFMHLYTWRFTCREGRCLLSFLLKQFAVAVSSWFSKTIWAVQLVK